ncbi:MAG: NFACT family protein [Candidatus Micrarchaeota archaeon]
MRSMANLEYSYICRELQSLVGGRLEKTYELEEGEFRFRFRVPGRYEDLTVVLGERMHLTRYIKEAPKIPTNITMYLRKRLKGAKLESIKQHGFDRVVVFDFGIFSLIFEMFAKGNIALTQPDGTIARVYRMEEWKDRVLKGGREYRFPQSGRISPPFDDGSLRDVLEPKALMAILSSKTNFGNAYLEEACLRAGLELKTDASKLSEEQVSSLVKELNGIYTSGKACVYLEDGKPVDYSLVALGKYSELECEETKTLSGAIDECVNAGFEGKGEREGGTESRRAKLEKRLQKQREHYESMSKLAEECKRSGDEIYSRYNEIEDILKTIREMRKRGKGWDEIKGVLKGRCEIDEHSGTLVLSN